MPNETKIYVPRVIAKAFGEYGRISLSFDVDSLIEFAQKHRDAKGYLTLNLCPRKEPGEKFGDTHYLVLDTWKPDPAKRRNGDVPKSESSSPTANDASGGAPF